MQKYLFNVAAHAFSIKAEANIPEMLTNLKPFIAVGEMERLFDITIDNSIVPTWEGYKVGTFPCPSATFEVYKLDDGAYRILVSNEDNIPCAFIQSDAEYKNFNIATRGNSQDIEFGLNNSIMVIYTICTAPHKTLLVHSSVVENNGRAYMLKL